MMNLLRYEFRRLFHATSFWVTTTLNVALVAIVALINKGILKDGGSSDGVSQLLSVASMGIFPIVLSIFVSIFVTEDYASGAIKNIVARGYKREAISFAKYFVSLLGGLLMLGASWAVAFLFGTMIWKMGTFDNGALLCILGQLLFVFASHAFYFLFANLFGKNGPAISINIAAPMAGTLLLALLDMLLKWQGHSLSSFWFANFSNTFSNRAISLDDFFIYGGTALAYVLVLTATSIILSKKKEF